MNSLIEDVSIPPSSSRQDNSYGDAGEDKRERARDSHPSFSTARYSDVDDTDPGLRGRVRDIPVEIEVVIGRAKLSVAELMHVHPDQIFSLNKRFGEPIELLVNGRLIGYGEIVADDFDNAIGVRMVQVVNE